MCTNDLNFSSDLYTSTLYLIELIFFNGKICFFFFFVNKELFFVTNILTMTSTLEEVLHVYLREPLTPQLSLRSATEIEGTALK